MGHVGGFVLPKSPLRCWPVAGFVGAVLKWVTLGVAPVEIIQPAMGDEMDFCNDGAVAVNARAHYDTSAGLTSHQSRKGKSLMLVGSSFNLEARIPMHAGEKLEGKKERRVGPGGCS